MINRNLGGVERLVRLFLAFALVTWVAAGDTLGWAQGIALLAAFALLWNAIFAKCYLWKWLGLNTECKFKRVEENTKSCAQTGLRDGSNGSGEPGA